MGGSVVGQGVIVLLRCISFIQGPCRLVVGPRQPGQVSPSSVHGWFALWLLQQQLT